MRKRLSTHELLIAREEASCMSGELSTPFMPIAVAVYLPEQYPRLLATAEDASDLEATWQEWYQVLQETKQKMAALGMHLIDVTVDLDELDAYCQQRGLANTSSTRTEYAAHVCLSSINDKYNCNSDHLRRDEQRKRNIGCGERER